MSNHRLHIPSPDEHDYHEAEDRQRWYALSRRSIRVGLLPSVWGALRGGSYEAAALWWCAVCQRQVRDARHRKRLPCDYCLHWMTRVRPR